jgi:hypothetical protein
MPHFGLMDPAALGPERADLQRARLHLRGGRRRLRQGKISAGVVTLYDALTSAMEWFCASPERRCLLQGALERFADDRALYAALVRGGVLDGTFDFAQFSRVVERALETELPPGDAAGILEGVQSVLTQLDVLPFDEGELPPEDPRTF